MPFGGSNVCERENEESPAALLLFERFSSFIWTFAFFASSREIFWGRKVASQKALNGRK
jgi:hypothetical protein